MKLTQKKVGLGIAALAVALMGSAAIADNMGKSPDVGMGGMMMMGPALNFDAVDADKDGKISPDEITAWRTAQAKAVDTNADGKLSVDELAAMRLKEMTTAATDQAQKMVDRLDTDGDKMLSAAELVAPPMPVNLFDKVDTNKDGFIDKAEADAAQKMMMERGHGSRGNRHQGGQDNGPDGGNGDNNDNNDNGGN